MKVILTTLLVIFSLNSYAQSASKEQTPEALRVLLETAPILNTKSPLRPTDLKGKIILVDFWTYGCINCIHVIPDLNFLEKKYPKELVVLGVHSAKFEGEKGNAEIKNAAARYGINHPVINDSDYKIWNAFGVRAWPTLILIDPDGKPYKGYSGEGHRESLDRDIQSLIQKNKGKLSSKIIKVEDQKHKMRLHFPAKIIEIKKFNSDGKKARDVYFLSDSSHHQVVGLDKNGQEFLRIGSGKEGFTKDSMSRPQGLAFKDHTLYIADAGNHALVSYDFKTKSLTKLAGNGERGGVWASPWDLEFISDDQIAIAMAGTHKLLGYNIKTKKSEVLAGSGVESINDGRLPLNSLSQPVGLSRVGDKLYFVDAETSSLRVLENGSITTLIGVGLFDFGLKDGDKKTALMQHVSGVYATAEKVYLADSYNNAIRVYDIKSGLLSTLTTGLRGPTDVIISGEDLMVVDTDNHAVKKVDLKTGKISKFFE